MPIVWTESFPRSERPLGYLRLLLARYRFHTRLALGRRGLRPIVRRVPGYRDRLESWRNKYKGRRCFVLGNGPSLKQMDLSVLKDEITIGCNGIYTNFDEWGWKVSYLLFEDIEQTELRRHDIPTVHGTTKLSGLHNAYAFPADDETCFMNVRNLDAQFLQTLFPQFSEDFPHQVHLASTVTYIGLQLAFHLGCDPVYVIGIDHNYGELPRLFPPCKITITEDNIHLVRGLHMKDDYYRVGDVIGVPVVDYMEEGYAKARQVYESRGRRIFNAGINSKLDVFERCDFAGLFGNAPAAPADGAPRILIISHDVGRLGAQVLLLSLVQEFVHRYGWNCRVIVREPNGTMLPDFQAVAPTDVFWPDPKNKRAGAHQDAIRRAVAEWAPDVVYSNTTSNADVIEFLKSKAPVVVHVHELQWFLSMLDDAARKTLVERSFLHIACSGAVKKNLVKNHGIPDDRVEVVYGAIDFDRLRRSVSDNSAAEARKQLGVPEHAILVGNCGRIDERKGWDVFIEMAQQVLATEDKARPVHFAWIGHGPNHQDLLKEAARRGIADRVHAPGPQDNPFPFLAAFDIEAMTSRDDPFPLVVMETAYLGSPVIAFRDAGGAHEFIGDDCGVVVEEMNAGAFAQAVNRLVHDDALRKRLGDNARARSAKGFDITRMSGEIARILHDRLGFRLPDDEQPAAAEPAAASPPGPRVVQFPEGRSLGKLLVRDWDSKQWDWVDLGPARGAVSIEAAKELYLQLDPAAANDLSAFRALDPADLQSVTLAGSPVTDVQLENLGGLAGLRTLDLRRVPISATSIRTLMRLRSLRDIVLPAQLDGDARARLARALPNTSVRIDAAPAVSTAATRTASPGARSVQFPDRAMGLLMVRAWDLPIWNWVELGPARGAVQVPANRELMLVVYPEWKDDLSPLARLSANDLQSLHLRPAAIGDSQVAHILHLDGLRTLDLRDTNITPAGVRQLAALRNARRIWLPPQIGDDVRAELAKALPECRIS